MGGILEGRREAADNSDKGSNLRFKPEGNTT